MSRDINMMKNEWSIINYNSYINKTDQKTYVDMYVYIHISDQEMIKSNSIDSIDSIDQMVNWLLFRFQKSSHRCSRPATSCWDARFQERGTGAQDVWMAQHLGIGPDGNPWSSGHLMTGLQSSIWWQTSIFDDVPLAYDDDGRLQFLPVQYDDDDIRLDDIIPDFKMMISELSWQTSIFATEFFFETLFWSVHVQSDFPQATLSPRHISRPPGSHLAGHTGNTPRTPKKHMALSVGKPENPMVHVPMAKLTIHWLIYKMVDLSHQLCKPLPCYGFLMVFLWSSHFPMGFTINFVNVDQRVKPIFPLKLVSFPLNKLIFP